MFTFIVTCYNQADVIVFALESIKYQIENFGEEQEFQLIIADDGSKDNSCEVIEQWIAKNKDYFLQVDRLFRKKNVGICDNYVHALKHIMGDKFAVINGDDLFAPYNLFEITARLDECDIVCTAFIKFTGSGEMIRSYHTYLEVVLQNFIRGNILNCAVKLGCPIMGTAVYRKSLLSDEIFNFILRFRTVNDRACFQKIFEENKNIKVCYVNRPVILYRISENSISNFNSPTRLLHSKEVALLCKIQQTTEKSKILRLLLLVQEKSAYFRASPNYFIRLLRFFSPYFIIMLWLCMLHYTDIRQMEKQLIDCHWRKCRAYYKSM